MQTPFQNSVREETRNVELGGCGKAERCLSTHNAQIPPRTGETPVLLDSPKPLLAGTIAKLG